ncbi:alpha/beta hydrolase family protein [Pseudomonas sp. HK3]
MKPSQLNHLLITLMLIACSSFVQAKSIEEHASFKHGEHRLAGYYKTPANTGEIKGVVLFVAGDGEIPYDAYGYYDVIWQVILDAGYAVFSWDKPGVGDSTGSWLNQSMLDRQKEVKAAISFVKNTYDYQESDIGLMGFSQAGWVAPAFMKDNPDIGFMIGVGYAINWMDQSWYMTKTRLLEESASAAEIQLERKKHDQEMAFWASGPSYKTYLNEYAIDPEDLSEARFNFIKMNVRSDATEDYVGINKPILLLMGDKDANVSTENSYRVLTRLFSQSDNAVIKIIPNATHGLLRHPDFDQQNPGLYFLMKLYFYGESAYAPEFLDTLSNWLKER